jgi:hypothetical protein
MPSPSGFDLKHFCLSGALSLALLLPCIASATLGQPESSVQTDAAQLKGSIKVTQRAAYRVHEIQLPTGTALREYVSSTGNVFALAWNGPHMPNLRQTLGQYFDPYVAAAKAKRTGHNHVQVELGNLVVQISGHMRAFMGRAYLPQAVPAGVSIGDLR